jgi:lysophospholipase L1-like esterase
MDVGVARSIGCFLALTLGMCALALGAETPLQPTDVFSLSAICRVPDDIMMQEGPLPRVTTMLRDQKRVVRILAIGSSSTVGLGSTTSRKRYPDQVADILEKAVKGLDIEIINRGVSGEIAKVTAERLKHEVALVNPDLVLWQVGTNDALARFPVEEYEAIVGETVAWVKSQGKDIVLVGLQYSKRTSTDSYCAAIREANARIAKKANILHVKRFSAMQFLLNAKLSDPPSLLSQDDFHLNDLGYRCMAEHVARAMALTVFAKKKNDAPISRLPAGDKP